MTAAVADRIDCDVAVVGSGFAGSLTALALARSGRRVALVERATHPRFAIGESSTPLANLLLENLADRYNLPRVRAFSKWGTWQRTHPEVAVGLKRGFTFFFHRLNEPFVDDAAHDRQLLVAASPHDEIGDTHWYRPDFDHELVREAHTAGVLYFDRTNLRTFTEGDLHCTLEGERQNRPFRITAPFVVDASGPRGFLHRTLGLPEAPLRWLPHTEGLYSHFTGVARWDDRHPPREGPPPFPRDAAALHHVFPGGWIWVLPFNNGITSAGAALTADAARRLAGDTANGVDGVDSGERWTRLLASLPSIAGQFRDARAVLPFVRAPRLAFRSAEVCGRRWAMLPSAAGVIDPLLSTGFPLTLLGILRLLDVLEHTADGADRRLALERYATVTQSELDATELLVAALYATMGDPVLFKRLSLLYFAAASYSEAARRLGRADLAPGFLLDEHPSFSAERRACSALALEPLSDDAREALVARIDRAIAPFDIAGLGDRTRRDWYPVVAADAIAGATKLQATAAQIDDMLRRCGFEAAHG